MKKIVITGHTKGIGKKLSDYLHNKGHLVYGISRSRRATAKFKQFQSDITSISSLKKIFDHIKKFDVLINNAAVSFASKEIHENFKRIVEINLIGTFNCCEISSRYLIGGSIINISSINAHLAFPNNPGYVSSKGGVCSLTRSLALDYSKKRINVNSISPGYIREGIAKKSFEKKSSNRERLSRMIIGRWGKANDLFGIIDFLISNQSSYITGQDFVIDGGWMAKGL